MQNQYVVFETTSGYCAIGWNALGITRFQLPAATRQTTLRNILRRAPGTQASAAPPTHVGDVIDAVKRYFQGEQVEFAEVRIDLEHQNDFFREIYIHLRKVRWGQSTTYGKLAAEAGAAPPMAREVGQAMALNPVPLLIPCHRVLAAGGKLGGFSAPGGAISKQRMLALEGMPFKPQAPAQQRFEL